jgi:hypothetical protein
LLRLFLVKLPGALHSAHQALGSRTETKAARPERSITTERVVSPQAEDGATASGVLQIRRDLVRPVSTQKKAAHHTQNGMLTSCDVAHWHISDMPVSSLNVRGGAKADMGPDGCAGAPHGTQPRANTSKNESEGILLKAEC